MPNSLMTSDEPSDWARHASAKFTWLAGLGVWMALCYFPAQAWNPRPPWLVPLLPFEPTPHYHPAWVLVYQSVWIGHAAMICVPVCLQVVRRYARDMALSYGLAAPVFWLWPTTVDRPEEGDVLYRALVLALDGTTNALPSLHAVMVALITRHVWPRTTSWIRGALVAWALMVLYATLATGQHRMLDLVTGSALALMVSFAGAARSLSR